MLLHLRNSVQNDLLRGTVDKFGVGHDDEKRAIIHVLNIVLEHPASVQRDFAQAIRAKEEMERKANFGGALHGADRLT